MSNSDEATGVIGAPRIWLRLEGLVVAGVAIWLYARGTSSWVLFAALILAPDVSLAGYLGGPRIGSWVYNVAHSYIAPLLLAVYALTLDHQALGIVFIWTAHIGVDRAFAIGLKFPTHFRDTHLGRIGGAAAQ